MGGAMAPMPMIAAQDKSNNVRVFRVAGGQGRRYQSVCCLPCAHLWPRITMCNTAVSHLVTLDSLQWGNHKHTPPIHQWQKNDFCLYVWFLNTGHDVMCNAVLCWQYHQCLSMCVSVLPHWSLGVRISPFWHRYCDEQTIFKFNLWN